MSEKNLRDPIGGLGAGRGGWTAGIRARAFTHAALMSLHGQHRGAPRRSGRPRSAPAHIGLPAVGLAALTYKASNLGSEMVKQRILACLLTLSAVATASAAISQTAPDYAAIVAAPDRSD